ncbi:DUF6941 family protein [Spongiibacter sp. UBA1325]|uniref:DUF6941 family protein n=1 Tax=Spongiibacter sp. UBA1325 TaxID=1947543 RepID=UPI00257DFA7F|nr:hypothetical protein [Spongiibacter sp. UBA1325]|tara:strand:- start:25744 stop:26151 length:408 start_codon:yes stop_codon:yes gene_type:complete
MEPYKFGAIFCDEIRHEDNGKILVLGAYGDQLIFPNFPNYIGSFTALFYFEFPHGEELSSFEVQLLVDGECASDLGADLESRGIAELNATGKESIRGSIKLVEHEFTKDAVIEIQAIIDNELTIKGPSLLVTARD